MAKKPPTKPRPDFPLFPHQCGQWCKKIAGKLRYFGVWADPSAALEKYLAERDELQAGRTPAFGCGASVADLCNEFLTSKRRMVDSGELTERSWAEYRRTIFRICRVLSKSATLEQIGPLDFDRLRADIAKTRAGHSIATEIQRCRSVFKFASDFDLTAKPVRMGINFRRPAKHVMRHARNKRPKRLIEADNLRWLIAMANVPMRSWILLGINCAFGQSDLASLPRTAVDLDAGWIRFPRPKTGIERDCPLWPETIAALRLADNHRYPPWGEDDGLFFRTKQRRPLVWYTAGGPRDTVGTRFRILQDATDTRVDGVGFYALRHTFRTVADAVKDQPAVRRIMGHNDEDPDDEMRETYVEWIASDRLLAVSNHVRAWLYPESQRDCENNQTLPAA